ncbi:LysM peptidoglycan-binding domain-containing protein [Kurthia sp. Dielmo]|uniref:cell division suppressor protein YneA n=1 Tax=Kurthia sp. Dielmo TaxID=1033738 RepID=UPI0011209A9A|nr:LysM peptidoglycan-binding domain-containing protein [Kurthia sp. Dielmo]
MIKWMKKNGATAGISAIVVWSMLLTIHGLFDTTDFGIIQVKDGDTLWTLAERYKGDMDREDWILSVKRENAIYEDRLYVGDELNVPNGHHNIEQIEVATNK